jgi:hypothetical protein
MINITLKGTNIGCGIIRSLQVVTSTSFTAVKLNWKTITEIGNPLEYYWK